MNRIDAAEKAVLYPVHIEAIMVGDNSFETANINEDYFSLSYHPAGQDLVQDTFTGSWGEYEPGIYLHFILPEEWTHGQQTKEGDVLYPPLPDRWIVTRFAVRDFPGRPAELLRKDWLIESNALFLDGDLEDYNTLIGYRDSGRPYRLLGRIREYNGRITGEDEHLKSLTAVSRGLDYFVGYYPECRTVLGFCDSLEDLEELPEPDEQDGADEPYNLSRLWRITYTISGWVEEGGPAADGAPACGAAEADSSLSVCHGLITDLNWYGSDYEYDTGIPQKMDMPRAVIGNSLEEALAALLKFHGKEEVNEELFQHLFFNTLSRLDELDGEADGKQKIHQGQFLSVPSPEKMVLEGKEIRHTREKGDLLDQIYRKRQERQTQEEEIQTLCQEIYLLWIKAIRDPSFQQEAAVQIPPLYQKFLQARMEYLAEKENRSEEDLVSRLQMYLNAREGEPEKIKNIPGEPYWFPKDYTVLLEGAGQSNVYGMLDQWKKEGKVFTRTDQEIVTRLHLTVKLDGKVREFDIDPESILREAGCTLGSLPPLAEKLALEGLMLARSCIFYYGNTIHRLMGVKKDDMTMTQLIQTWEESLNSSECTGQRPPSPAAIHIWRPSWNPLLLEWMLRYYPDSKTREGKCDLSGWKLGENDYIYREADFPEQEFEVITGRSVLTFSGADNLTNLFAAYAKEENVRRQIQKVKSLRILSQKMQGMTEALLGRDSSLLISPDAKPDSNSDSMSREARIAFDCLEQGFIDRNLNTTLPRKPLENFHAVRAGKAELSGIRVIDSFGRVLDYEDCEVIVSNKLGDSNVTESFWARPRVLAPLRLSAFWNYIPVSWGAAGRNTSETEASVEEVSPIYGWLWPNIVDSCLHVYCPDGKMAGIIQSCFILQDGKKTPAVQLRNPPGETKTEEELLTPLNEKLREFLTAFLAACRKEPPTLSEMVMILDESMWDIREDGAGSQSSLYAWLGRPVALAGVRTVLELKGKAPGPVEYTREKSYKSPLKSMKLSMRVGEVNEQKDGTIGIFHHGQGNGYSHFYPCRCEEHRSSYFGKDSSVETYLEQEEEFTILCSPYGTIKFTTGLLPVKALKLNEKLVEKAMEQIYLTLYCAPVLTEDPPRLPLPSAMEKKWLFLEYGKEGEKKVTNDIRVPWSDADHKEEPLQIREGWLMLYAERREP